MLRYSLYLFFTLLFISCKDKDEPIITPPVVTPTGLIQYGTPFSGVPDREDAIIYQVNMRPFSAKGNFAGVVERLDSIKALGANVIYLMPIYPVGKFKAFNSPYCVMDYQKVNPEFGNLDDLRAIVDGAHTRGMSVILDWVANHTSFDNPWISAHTDWYVKNSAGAIINPPGFNWTDVAQLDFKNGDMRKEMISSMKYWVYAANVDGFRMDYTDGPPVDFWKQAIDTMRSISTHKLLMFAEGSRTANFSAGFDYNFGFGFFDQLKKIFGNNNSALTIDGLNNTEYSSATNGQQIIRYTTNHDVNGSDGTPLDLFGGLRGSMSAFVIASTMKSIPMIYGSQEVGFPTKIVFPFTGTKINWSLNPALKEEYKKILKFRAGSDAMKRGTLATFSTTDVCAFTKEKEGKKVFVIANVRNKSVDLTIPVGLVDATAKDVINGGTKTLGAKITLAPYEYFILNL